MCKIAEHLILSPQHAAVKVCTTVQRPENGPSQKLEQNDLEVNHLQICPLMVPQHPLGQGLSGPAPSHHPGLQLQQDQ